MLVIVSVIGICQTQLFVMRQEVDVDVVALLAFRALVHRRQAVSPSNQVWMAYWSKTVVLDLQLQPVAEERLAAAGVDDDLAASRLSSLPAQRVPDARGSPSLKSTSLTPTPSHHLGAELAGVVQEQVVELAAVDVVGVVLVDAGLLALLEADVGAAVAPRGPPNRGSYSRLLPVAVQTAPNLCGNFSASMILRKSRSLNTRVDEGTSDSPTWGRGYSSRSNTMTLAPALARYAPSAPPAGPPPMMPTSKSVCSPVLLIRVLRPCERG